MGMIDTEGAARRLARVILSDIDLYMRERPKAGESREAQIEEGRRHFASRVTPELVPVFAMILADRAGTVNAPPAPAARPLPASDAAPDVGRVSPSPAPDSASDDEPATEPHVAPPAAAALPAATRVTPSAADPPPPIQPARISIRRMLAIARDFIASGIGRFRPRHDTRPVPRDSDKR